MFKKILSKDITNLCNIKEITEQGGILVEDEVVEIYQVDPINIVSYDAETKRNIYNMYFSIIRGLPNNFQIVIFKEKDSMKQDIQLYKNRLLIVENYGLKMAIKKYIEYLEELEKNSTIYTTKHYLVTKLDNSSKDIVDLFTNLRQFGLCITKIKNKKDIEKVLKRAME